MLNARRWLNAATVVLLAAFGYGALQLYLLHYSAGDVYPPYSTLRADPVGAKALYEALDSFPALHVERNMQPLTYNGVRNTIGNRSVTLLLLGTDASDPDHAPLELVRAMEHVMARGGRVVITFMPTWDDLRLEFEEEEARLERIKRMREQRMGRRSSDPEDDSSNDDEDTEDTNEDSDGQPKAEADEPRDPSEEERSSAPEDEDDEEGDLDSSYAALDEDVKLEERWGVRLEFDEIERRTDGTMQKQWAEWKSVPGLPSQVSWRTAISFSRLSEEWSIIYERGGRPVVIERPFGAGSLVFSSDSYFLSNEALRDERHAELLTWLVGPHRTVVFDETHLGIFRSPGIMTLVRGYGLYGTFWGLVVLALLYIWKNAFSFVPPYEEEVQADARHAVGKDSAAGFTNLLRRGVKPRDLLDTCLAEYRHSLGHREKDMAEPLSRMKALADAERGKPANMWNPADAYAAMSQALAEYLGRRTWR